VAARALAAAAAARRSVASPLWPVLTPLVDDLTARSAAAPAQPHQDRDDDLLQILGRTLDELADVSPSAATGPSGER
jgi:hypothetical protein